MKKSKKQIKNFILKTLLPYKEDVNNCAYNGSLCKYLTTDGRKCAVGRWMKKGEWQGISDTIDNILTGDYGQSQIFLKPALDMNFSVEQWRILQLYHDSFATKSTISQINYVVKELEYSFDIELPELLISN